MINSVMMLKPTDLTKFNKRDKLKLNSIEAIEVFPYCWIGVVRKKKES